LEAQRGPRAALQRARGALWIFALSAGALCMPVSVSPAQGAAPAAPAQPEWKNYVALYFMGASQDGDVTVGGLDGDLDLSFEDLLDHLDFGAMLSWRGETPTWFVALDAVYMDLSGEKQGNAVTADASFEQLVLEADVGVRLTPQLDAFVGARYWSLDGDLELSGPGPGQQAGGQEQWIDPVIGARCSLPFADAWALVLRGDVGGFGVGSDFTWQGIARLDWRVSESVSVDLGYRYVYVDYQDGSGADEFAYDVATSGPLLGVIFGF
jgi:opacity protein-like surface antigen